jgi:hypothetical protein
MGYEGLIGETITMRGQNGDAIEAYHGALNRLSASDAFVGSAGSPPTAQSGRASPGGACSGY